MAFSNRDPNTEQEDLLQGRGGGATTHLPQTTAPFLNHSSILVLDDHNTINNINYPILFSPHHQEGAPWTSISEINYERGESSLLQETSGHQQQLIAYHQPHDYKLKASNINALLLKIGDWKFTSKREGDLIVKFYYGKKKIVWEFLDGSLKKKIEFPWANIAAIDASVGNLKIGCLQIELNAQPQLFVEINFTPNMHTQWATTEVDFTQGQACICMRRTIFFPPRLLDIPYLKLLQSNKSLFVLSQLPFPYESPPMHVPGSQSVHYGNQSNGNIVMWLLPAVMQGEPVDLGI